MNIREAKKELEGRQLVFGDEKQIEAIQFLEEVERVKERVKGMDEEGMELMIGEEAQISDDVAAEVRRWWKKRRKKAC